MRAALCALLLPGVVAGCVGDETAGSAPTVDAGPVHVHGLGVNPAGGDLFVASHTGLFSAEPGEQTLARVTDRRQDTMGFTVVGPDLPGIGPPGPTKDLPPLLGLIESSDAGTTWRPVSLLGRADFHILRAVGHRVYGFGSASGRLIASTTAAEPGAHAVRRTSSSTW